MLLVTPSPSIETAAQKTFRTHARYIRAFARVAGFVMPTSAYLQKAHETIGALTVASSTYRTLGPRTCDVDQVAASLGNAWGTELLLGLSGRFAEEDALVRLTNNWGVVQLYYVLYHATQALFVARTGQARPTSHLATQKDFADYWLARSVDLPPWSLGAAADGFRNWPTGRSAPDPKIHPWEACTANTCWDLAALALRTTRQGAIEEALGRRRSEKQRGVRRAWNEKQKDRLAASKRPLKERHFAKSHLAAAERADVAAKVRPYGLIDYAYRLRIKTNYDDSAMFTEGPIDEAESVLVHTDMSNLASASLLVYELHLRRLLGTKALGKIMDRWIAANHGGAWQMGVALRRPLVLDAM